MTTERQTQTPRNMRSFFIIWAGQVVSIVGSGLTGFALAVWIFERTGEATPFALTALFATLPRVLIAPVAGAVADRYNRRTIMILADTGNALLALVVFLILRSGTLEIWQIFLIAGVGSVFSGFQEPAFMASITMLVPKRDFARASGMVQMAQAIETLVAPLLAGVLFVAIGLQGIVLIDFITFFFAIGALLIVRIPDPEPSEEETGEKRSIWGDIAFGWNYLRIRTGLLALLIYFAVVNYLLNSTFVLMGPLVLSFASAATLGVLQSVIGVGMLVGSVVISTWGGPRRKILGLLGIIAMGGVGVTIAGVQASPFVIGAGILILALMAPIASGVSQAVFMSKIEPSVQGRVFAMRGMVARSITPLAFLTAGVLADRIFEPLMSDPTSPLLAGIGSIIGTGTGRGIGLMFVIAGILMIVATGVAYAYPRLRLVEQELPDVVPDVQEAEETSITPSPATETAAAGS